jgi:hypothetical protein
MLESKLTIRGIIAGFMLAFDREHVNPCSVSRGGLFQPGDV